MMNATQLKEMRELLSEFNVLSEKLNTTPQERSRIAFLQTAIAAVKEGGSARDLHLADLNEIERRNKLPLTKLNPEGMTPEQRSNAALFRTYARGERRDIEGSPMLSHLGTYTGLGYFVPTEFMATVFNSLKAYDFLFDDDVVTMIRTTNGRPITIPTMSDTENDAAVVAEAGSTTSTDVAQLNQAALGVYNYSTRRWQVSLEAFDDLEGALSAQNLFGIFTAKAIARGVGRDLVTGNGTSKPLGLIPALLAAGAPIVSATGASGNDGLSETGANSVGGQDLANALAALDPAYLGPKTVWGMNNATLNYLRGIVAKSGKMLDIVRDTPDGPEIFGIPVRIAPSMDNLGASQHPIVLGNFEYWATRIVTAGENMGIKKFQESPGLIENGLVGFRSFVRAGGALLWNDTGSPCPFVLVQNHS